MSLLKRLFGKSDHPAWANFLSQSDLKQFQKDLISVLDRKAKPYVLDITDCCWWKEGEESLHGLVNMAQGWRQTHTSDRVRYLEGFVANVLDSKDLFSKEFSFDDVRDQLRVRLYPLDMYAEFQSQDLKKCSAFLTLLAIDFPNVVQTVGPEQVKDWGFEGKEEDLYRIALDQTWKYESVSVSGYDLDSEISIRSVTGDSFFSASHALVMDRYIVPENPLGALVVIPHRHAFVFYSIENWKGVNSAVQTLLPMGQGMYEEGPGSITPELLWWRDGKFTVVPVDGQDVHIPEDLQALLEA